MAAAVAPALEAVTVSLAAAPSSRQRTEELKRLQQQKQDDFRRSHPQHFVAAAAAPSSAAPPALPASSASSSSPSSSSPSRAATQRRSSPTASPVLPPPAVSSAASPASEPPASPSTAALLSSHPAVAALRRKLPQLNDAQVSAVAHELLQPPPAPAGAGGAAASASSCPALAFPPLSLIACPGSGKTLTLAARVAFFITHHRVPPRSILCITFTKKAEQELRHRVSSLTGGGGQQAWDGLAVRTFHSLALKTLLTCKDRLGFDHALDVLARPQDVRDLVKEAVQTWWSRQGGGDGGAGGGGGGAAVASSAGGGEEGSVPWLLPASGPDRSVWPRWQLLQDEEELEMAQAAIKEEQKRPSAASPTAAAGTSAASSSSSLLLLSPLTSALAAHSPPSSSAQSTAGAASSLSVSSALPLLRYPSSLDQQAEIIGSRILHQRRTAGLCIRRSPVTGRPCLRTRVDTLQDGEEDLGDVIAVYDALLQQRGQLTLDDFIPAVLALFRQCDDVLATVRCGFHCVFVDEAQDSSRADLCMLLALIGFPHWRELEEQSRRTGRGQPLRWTPRRTRVGCGLLKHLCAVGDPQQSIYGWRGADSRAFDLLQSALGPHGLHTLSLAQNYRSSQHIVDAASAIIAMQDADSSSTTTEETACTSRFAEAAVRRRLAAPFNAACRASATASSAVTALPSRLMVTQNSPGLRVVELESLTVEQEAAMIVQEMRQLASNDGRYAFSDMAVLARTNQIVRWLRRAFRKASIPLHRRQRVRRRVKEERRQQRQRESDSSDDDDGAAASGRSRGRDSALRRLFDDSLETEEWKDVLSLCHLVLQSAAAPLPPAEPTAAAASLRHLLLKELSQANVDRMMAALEAAALEALSEQQPDSKRRRGDSGERMEEEEEEKEEQREREIRSLYDVAVLATEDAADAGDSSRRGRLRAALQRRISRTQRVGLGEVMRKVHRLTAACVRAVHQQQGGEAEHKEEDGDARLSGLQLIASAVFCCAEQLHREEDWELSEVLELTPPGRPDASPAVVSSPSSSSSSSSLSSSSPPGRPPSALSARAMRLQDLKRLMRLQARCPLPRCPQSRLCDGTCGADRAGEHCPRWLSSLSSLHAFLHCVDAANVDALYPADRQREEGQQLRATAAASASLLSSSSSSSASGSSTAAESAGVHLSTIHRAKGLEWPVVFVASFNEDVLPLPGPGPDPGRLQRRQLQQEEQGKNSAWQQQAGAAAAELMQAEEEEEEEKEEEADSLHLREECRLAYVAVTRAQSVLYLSYSQLDALNTPRDPSRFLAAIPQAIREKRHAALGEQEERHEIGSGTAGAARGGATAVPRAAAAGGRGMKREAGAAAALPAFQRASDLTVVKQESKAWGAAGGKTKLSCSAERAPG